MDLPPSSASRLAINMNRLARLSPRFSEVELLLLGELAGAFQDQLGALACVEHDISLAQLLRIIGEILHSKRLRRHEAVAARLIASGNGVDLERHDLAVEQAEDGVKGTYPAERTVAPAHRFRPGEAGDDRGHHSGHDFFGGAAGALDAGDVEIALLVLFHLNLFDQFQSSRFEEALDR